MAYLAGPNLLLLPLIAQMSFCLEPNLLRGEVRGRGKVMPPTVTRPSNPKPVHMLATKSSAMQAIRQQRPKMSKGENFVSSCEKVFITYRQMCRRDRVTLSG